MNPRRFIVFSGLHFVLFPIPIVTLFWKDQIGMSLTDIMVLQAVFGIAVAIAQFPSGYFADRVGYRASLLVGAILQLAGWLWYARGESFAAIAVAEIVLGVGSAFITGADRALLFDTLDATGRARDYTRWEGRGRAASQVGEAASSAVGGWLYSISPRLPFWLQIPVATLVLVSAATLRGRPRPPHREGRSHLQRALHIVRFTLWSQGRLRAAMALSVALGLASFVMVWLIQSYMQARGIPPAWFGPLWAGAHVWLAGVTLASAGVLAALGSRVTLLGCCVLVLAGYAGLAATSGAWGIAFYLCFMTVRGLQGPILSTVMLEDAPVEDRASVLSLAALLFRVAFVVAGPPIGALVDHVGMERALAVLAVVFTAASLGALAAFATSAASPPAARGSSDRA